MIHHWPWLLWRCQASHGRARRHRPGRTAFGGARNRAQHGAAGGGPGEGPGEGASAAGAGAAAKPKALGAEVLVMWHGVMV